MTQDKLPTKVVPIVCAVLERHDIHHEPVLLRVIGDNEQVDLKEQNDFVILYANPETFKLTKL